MVAGFAKKAVCLGGVGGDGQSDLQVKCEGRSVHGDHRFVFDGFYIGNGETPHELVADEAREVMGGGILHGLCNAFHTPVRTSKRADFALSDLIVERLKEFGDWSLRIIPMQPIQVDILRLQTAKALVKISNNILA